VSGVRDKDFKARFLFSGLPYGVRVVAGYSEGFEWLFTIIRLLLLLDSFGLTFKLGEL
jgi:hypothetical protein